jgi:hypothetical protein
MILAGEAIEDFIGCPTTPPTPPHSPTDNPAARVTRGVCLGRARIEMSTMASAAWGNLVSDMAGVFLGGTVAQAPTTPHPHPPTPSPSRARALPRAAEPRRCDAGRGSGADRAPAGRGGAAAHPRAEGAPTGTPRRAPRGEARGGRADVRGGAGLQTIQSKLVGEAVGVGLGCWFGMAPLLFMHRRGGKSAAAPPIQVPPRPAPPRAPRPARPAPHAPTRRADALLGRHLPQCQVVVEPGREPEIALVEPGREPEIALVEPGREPEIARRRRAPRCSRPPPLPPARGRSATSRRSGPRHETHEALPARRARRARRARAGRAALRWLAAPGARQRGPGASAPGRRVDQFGV